MCFENFQLCCVYGWFPCAGVSSHWSLRLWSDCHSTKLPPSNLSQFCYKGSRMYDRFERIKRKGPRGKRPEFCFMGCDDDITPGSRRHQKGFHPSPSYLFSVLRFEDMKLFSFLVFTVSNHIIVTDMLLSWYVFVSGFFLWTLFCWCILGTIYSVLKNAAASSFPAAMVLDFVMY